MLRFPTVRSGVAVLIIALLASVQIPESLAQDSPAAKEAPGKPSKADKAKPARKAKPAEPELTFPPALPDGLPFRTDTSKEFLRKPDTIAADVDIARTPPTIDFAYLPGQDYPGHPWSNWGDSLAANGKYYASIGDHLAVGGKEDPERTGTGRVFEYDPAKKSFRRLADIAELLKLPADHYVPGKIHSRLDLGADGWLYFSTHRGSTTVTADRNHYEGDWILRCHPETGRSEVVVHAPVPKHCIPTSVVDPERMIFYGGTAPGTDAPDKGIQFFAYDLKNRKLLFSGPDGPARCMIFARSTGRVYFVPGNDDAGKLVRFDPAKPGAPTPIEATLGMRAASLETPQGVVYAASNRSKNGDAELFAFDVKTETVENLGPATVGGAGYITTIDADASGRYLYYIPGAHGGSERDGSAVVQFDTRTKRRKVIAFLHPFYKEQCGATLVGTYSAALNAAGDTLFVTWNVNRSGRVWDCCALTAIHIPAEERP